MPHPFIIRLEAVCALLLAAACNPLAKQAAAGDADAQFRYGRTLLQKDKRAHAKNALSYFRAAAEQGHPAATAAVAFCHEKGLGTPRNRHLARSWYGKAERLGHVGSTFALAALELQDGNAAGAIRCLEPLCELHCLQAELSIAFLYMSSKSPCFNPEKGVRYLRYAAMDGSTGAAELMAVCYEKGLGVPRNEKLAQGWRRIARERGGLSL